LRDRGETKAPLDREVAIALARLTPASEFHQPATLADLGEKYGVTRERIRQIQIRVVRRLAARVRRKSSLTARTLDKMTQAMPPDCREAPLSWFAGELSGQSYSKTFREFMLTAFLVDRGIPTKEARRQAKEATAIRPLHGAENSLSQQENKGDASPGDVEGANAFVMRILKKAVWPKQLNDQLAGLSEFPPLKECKYHGQYYSKALERFVGFDSWGEARLIRALGKCTVVTEFAEQPMKIGYRFDGRDCTYIPDLLVKVDPGLLFVIEIKGRRQLADRRVLAKADAAGRELGECGIGYCLADVDGFGLDDLVAMEPDDQFLRRLEVLLRVNGTVRRDMFEEAFDEKGLEWAYNQLQRAVLREGMQYDTWLRPVSETRYHFGFRLRA